MAIHDVKVDGSDAGWRSLYLVGAIAAMIFLIGGVIDIIAGTMGGGDITAIPSTAVGRFAQFNQSWPAGLYNLDFLNMVTALIMVPVFVALAGAHRRTGPAFAGLAVVLFVTGVSIFTANNAALGMLDLSVKYAAAPTDVQRSLFAAAGEALLAKGAHGSFGVFPGFFLITLSNLLISIVMLRGGRFNKATGILGVIGGCLLLIYLILVTFFPATQVIAVLLAAPGGLCSLAWMILFSLRLFKMKD